MSQDTPELRQPLYSPVPLEVVQQVVDDAPLSEDVVPTLVDALDELQLSLLQDPDVNLGSLRRRAARSYHLFVDEYPGQPGDRSSQLAFLSGEVAQTYFRKHLPDLEPLEEDAVRQVLREYASQPGIDYTYEPEVTPVVTRVVPYDTVVADEPGPVYPPQPAQHRRSRSVQQC